MKLLIAIALLFIAVVSANRVFLERDVAVAIPKTWKLVNYQVNPSTQHTIQITIKNRNIDVLTAHVDAISDPKNSRYGESLTHAEICEITKPAKAVTDLVLSWLKVAGIQESQVWISYCRDSLSVKASVSQLESLLGVKFQAYKHIIDEEFLIRSLGPYSTPSEVAEHLDFIASVVGFPKRRKMKVTSFKSNVNKKQSDIVITPPIVREACGIPKNATGTSSTNSMSVAEFSGQFYNPSDLKQFFRQFVPGDFTDTVAKVIGNNQPGNAGIESSLDIEYIMGVALNVPAWFYEGSAGFDAWMQTIMQPANHPYVHSVSYGYDTPPSNSYMSRLNDDFKKIAATRRSIIFASGDSGVGCSSDGNEFQPDFPADAPYATGVGATRFVTNNVTGEQAAVNGALDPNYRSGGGFSRFFDTQSFQQTAVAHYLATANLPSSHYFNKGGRGFPDVAALGSITFQIIVNGQVMTIGGTSCAAPVFSAVISLINDFRLNNGKSALGWLNPALYQNAGVLNDITMGSNPSQSCPGFQTAKGWDPVTGLGVPNFPMMMKVLGSM